MHWPEALNTTRLLNLLFGVIFLTSGLIVNFFQFILYVLLRPISKPLFRKLNRYLTYSSFSLLVYLEQYWANVRANLHCQKSDYDKYFGKEHALLIMNHSYEVDWLIGWILCEHCGTLGNCKIIGKKSLQYLPAIGLAWRFGGSIFVERNWQKDRNVFENKLQEMVQYSDPIWLLIAAEGTRFTKEKHEASLSFARQHKLPEMRHHLTPRTKGFTTTIPLIRNNIKAIYNVSLGIKPNGVPPTLTNILLGKSISADFYVERISMDELPESEADLGDWLHKLYKRKDNLLDCYLRTGNWLEAAGKPYVSLEFPRNKLIAINFFFWSIVILLPLGYFLLKLFISGSMTYLSTACGIIGSFVYCLDKLVGESKISNSSSYGINRDMPKNYGVQSKR